MIPAYSPRVAVNQKAYVDDALDRNELSFRGAYHGKFERAAAAACERTHGVLTSSGTTALAAAYHAAGLGGKRVLAPTLTYVATINQLVGVGATPVLVDCDYRLQMHMVRVAAALDEGLVDAVVVAPLYGACPDMVELERLCRSCGVPLVVDAAEAFGANFGGQPVASYGDVATLSFFANKLVTSGEGGAVATDDPHLAASVLSYINHATIPGYRHTSAVATNARLTNLQAAVGLSQVEELATALADKERVLNEYLARLGEAVLFPNTGYAWVVVARLRDGATYRAASRAAAAGGVELRPVFRPVHTLSAFADLCDRAGDLSLSANLCERFVVLPSGPDLSATEIARVVDVVGPFLKD